jgi:mercuric ion transport protein
MNPLPNSSTPLNPSEPGVNRSTGSTLVLGGLAALLASTCCLGPLVLLLLGVSGAWISNLTLLEPLQPYFVGAALLALVLAYRRIWRSPAVCEPGQVCALPQVNRNYKRLFWGVVALVVLAVTLPQLAPLFY